MFSLNSAPLPKFNKATQRRRKVKPRAPTELRYSPRLSYLGGLEYAAEHCDANGCTNVLVWRDPKAERVVVMCDNRVEAVVCAWSDE
jgi:hypothetical protein